jgi:hypothetical protein
LFDKASGLAPQLGVLWNELAQLAHFGINEFARRH